MIRLIEKIEGVTALVTVGAALVAADDSCRSLCSSGFRGVRLTKERESDQIEERDG